MAILYIVIMFSLKYMYVKKNTCFNVENEIESEDF